MRNKTHILLVCLLALSTWCFTACDDTIGGTNEGTTVGFPSDTLVVEVVPGDTVPVSFNVGYDWRVTSDKDWCRVDGFKYKSGKPGEHTVEFVIGEPDNLFTDNEALITMRMNDDSRVIARIICLASMEYMVEVSAGDRVYESGESIVIGASGQVSLNLNPNFKIGQLRYDFPKSWMEVYLVESVMTLKVKADSLKYVFNNECDSLYLSKDSTYHSSFHIQYVGMEPRMVLIEGQLEEPLVVSRNAKYAYMNNENGERKEMPAKFTVTALNDEYQIMSLGYDNANGYSILEERWFELTDDSCGNISLSVSEVNRGKDRNVTLLAFPKIMADSLADVGIEGVVDFLYETVDGETALRADSKKYLLAQMTQYGATDLTIEPEAQWGLKVAVDGMTYATSTLSDTLAAPLKASVKTDYGYKLLHVNYDLGKGCTIMPESESWLKVADDNQGNIEVRFDRNVGNMRTAYLLALPVVIAEDEENLEAELFVEAQVNGPLELRDDAVKYVVGQFIQDAEEESSMKVIDALFGWKYLAVEKETDPKWIGIATGKGVAENKIFRTDLKSGANFMLNPLLDEKIWDPGKPTHWLPVVDSTAVGDSIVVPVDSIPVYGDCIAVYGESGRQYTNGVHFQAEPTKMEEEEGNYVLIQFKAEYDIEEDYYIIYFIDEDKYLKALVVYNYWE